MMRYNGVFITSRDSVTISGVEVLIELQVPSGTQIDILRAWVGPIETRVGGWANSPDDVQDVDIYGNDAVATGGSALVEQAIRGQDDAASGVTALGGPAVGATPTVIYPDSFHIQNGWLYLPQPEERIRVVGGATIDNIGIRFPVAPSADITMSFGIIWGEIG